MKNLRWTGKAKSDLVRLHDFLHSKNPKAAASVLQDLVKAPEKLIDYPEVGEALNEFAPRNVRRIFMGPYEICYEIAPTEIYVLRIWHGREMPQ
jgi:plasmid stabilization system protein ParE